jgi:hypothetical protein
MYRRAAVLMSLALSGVLAGCGSSTTISVYATGSFIGLIQARFHIPHPGTYDYVLTYAHLPPEPGANAQTCLPWAGFRLSDEYGGLEDLIPTPMNASGQTRGSFYFFPAGTWTGSDGLAGSPSIPNLGPPSPPGTFEALSCPWSLTLTPSN